MRGALIHGVLLVVMLVFAYRTWTRDKTVTPVIGSVALWDKTDSDLASIEMKTDKKTVRLERRGDGADAYWWGIETTIEKKPKPKAAPPVDAGVPDAGSGSAGSGSAGSGSAASGSAANGSGSAGSGSGSAGSGSGSGSAAPPEMEETQKVREFPLGDAADKVIKNLEVARALRDLGTPTDDVKKDYKLTDAKTTLTISFRDGARTFLVGGPVFGGSDKYVLDQTSGIAYVMSKDVIGPLETGESALHLLDPRGFDATKIDAVTIAASGKSKTAARVTTGVDDKEVKTWGDPDTKKADQTLANFIDNANNLKPTEFLAQLKVADLTTVFALTFTDAAHAKLGTLTLYKHEKPGELAPDATLDPANPPKGELEYYIMTEKTRVPGLVRKDTAQRAENDVATVFGEKPPNDIPATPPPPPHGHPGMGPGGHPGGPPGMHPGGGPPMGPMAPGAPGPMAPGAPGPMAPGAPVAPTTAPAAPGKLATPAPAPAPAPAMAPKPATPAPPPAAHP